MVELREIVNYVRSILKSAGEPVGPPERGNPFEQVAKPIATDYSEVDAEGGQGFRRRGDKAFLMEDAKPLTHLMYPFT